MTDQNVESVRKKLAERAAIGLAKYGVTTERGDLTTLQWLKHAQEEAMDFCVYLERLIRDRDELEQELADYRSAIEVAASELQCEPARFFEHLQTNRKGERL